ncbi:chitobiosyldiphosphodolichol beta-mannosyltransferase-like [Cryptosporidium felis]|nr:chitobiosyldiphosphodolichol beta-mannosyltransferase-like [Cryptosporidium felis]
MQNHAMCLSQRFCSGTKFPSSSRKSSGCFEKKTKKKKDGLQSSVGPGDKINNNRVFLVGYNESACGSAITKDKNIAHLWIKKSSVERFRETLPFWVFLIFKVIEQSMRIFLALMSIPNLGGILLQVPPSIPAIPICLFISFLRGAPLIIDWHNYGHTLLVQTRGASPSFIKRLYLRILINSYKVLEFSLGRLSHSAFCVSKAMQEDLSSRGIQATVVYDRPNSEFKFVKSISERHSVLFKYFGELGEEILDSTLTSEFRQNSKSGNKKKQDGSQKLRGKIGKIPSSGVSWESKPTFTNVRDIGIRDTLVSVLEKEVLGSLFEVQKKSLTPQNGSSRENRFEEEFRLEISPGVLEEISPRIRSYDLKELMIRNVLNNIVFETSPVSKLDLSYNQADNKLALRVRIGENRPAVVITSTSWTPDEDLNLLLEGIIEYDKQVSSQSDDVDPCERLPDLFLIVTGKGPEKRSWLEAAYRTKMRHVKIRTVFVEADDYPRLLASSDLGISLHYSSSGLDLPMKVVDMLGAGIPVISYTYPTIGELLNSKKIEIFFSDSQGLKSILVSLLRGFGAELRTAESFPSPILNKLGRLNKSRVHETFFQEWSNKAAFHFEDLVI